MPGLSTDLVVHPRPGRPPQRRTRARLTACEETSAHAFGLGTWKPQAKESTMNKKLLEIKASSKLMWGCAAIVLLVAIVALTTSSYVLLFIVPCMLMMGGMMWMMMGGMSGRTHRGEHK
jgi:uncharacterized membrane protein YbhN (UPF0104 family)